MKTAQSGNVLFFILIGIFLLGGLTVLLSRTGSQTEDTGSVEQARIAATSIVRATSGFHSAIQNMLTRGCSESGLSFDYTGSDGRYANTSAPSDKSCHLFEPQGGGLSYKFVPTNYVDSTYSAAPYYGYWVFMGRICIDNVGPTGGTNCKSSVQNPNELLVVLAFVKKEICEQLNVLGGFGPIIPAEPNTPWPAAYAEGLYGTTYKFQPTAYPGMTPLLSGKKFGCFETTTVPGTYHFYHAVIPR